ncbi:MAG: HTH domain-containing protein [Bacteroidales bacterium]
MSSHQSIHFHLARLYRELASGRPGGAKEMAARLGISRRTLFNYLEILRSEGTDIRYNRVTGHYYIFRGR